MCIDYLSTFVLSALLALKLVQSETIIPTSTINETETYLISSSNVYDDIICMTDECHIICDTKLSCYKVNIYAKASNILTLDCDGKLSCEYTKIINGAKDINDIYCTNTSSCSNANFDLSNTSNINIMCNYSYLSVQYFSSDLYTQSPCYLTTVTAENSGNINVHCDAYGCNEADFNINGSHAAEFNFEEHGGRMASISNTYIEKELIINCNDGYSCNFMDIYCPFSAQCIINCNADDRCTQHSIIYVESRIYDKLNINFVASDIYSLINFNCIGAGPEGESELKINSVGSRYECSASYDGFGCCPDLFAKDIYTCTDGKDCHYQCNEVATCQNTIIDGSAASSLTVTCTADEACEGSKIMCPSSNYSSCKVLCEGTYSCQYITIEANTADYIDEFSFVCDGGLHSCNGGWILFDFISTNKMDLIFATSSTATPVQIDYTERVSLINTYNFNCTSGCGPYLDEWITPFTKNNIIVNDLDIYCVACYDGIFNFSVTNSMSLFCDSLQDYGTCSGEFNIILLNKSVNVNIECQDKGSYSWTTGACDGYFNIMSSQSINDNRVYVSCYDSASCGFGTFRYINIDKVTMDCMQQYSCRAAIIYATESNEFLLNCNNDDSCKESNIYCPFHAENICKIRCNDYDAVCDEMVIYVNHDYKYNYLDITYPVEYIYCYDPWSITTRYYCVNIDFNCYGDGNQRNNKLNTSLIYDDQILNNFKCQETHSSYCCPWNTTYITTTSSVTTSSTSGDQTDNVSPNHYYINYHFLLFAVYYIFLFNM